MRREQAMGHDDRLQEGNCDRVHTKKEEIANERRRPVDAKVVGEHLVKCGQFW